MIFKKAKALVSVMIKLINLLTFPLLIFNLFGGIIAIIWLLVLGEWQVIVFGFITASLSPYIIGLLLLPRLLFHLYLERNNNKKNPGFWFSLLGNFYLMLAVILWSLGVLYLNLELATSSTFVPVIILSYSIATGPWMESTRRKRMNNKYEVFLLFSLELAYLVMLIQLFLEFSLKAAVISFLAIFLVLSVSFTALIYSTAGKNLKSHRSDLTKKKKFDQDKEKNNS